MVQRWVILAGICAAMIAVHVVDLFLGGFLKSFGIHPREMGSAYTIATAPWLHRDLAHLGSNLPPLIVLGALCMLNGTRYFLKASAIIILLGGAMLWMFGRGETNHFGASGWVFGLWSLAIARAWYDRSFMNFAIAVGVAFFYGGMIFGVFPTDIQISFEGHLFGAVAGVVAASVLSSERKTLAQDPVPEPALKFWS